MKHYYQSIKGAGSSPFRRIYTDTLRTAKDGDVWVEIGTFKGRSASFAGVEIINSGKDVRLYTVDHFLGSVGGKLNSDPDIRNGTAEQVARRNLEPVSQAVTLLAMPSSAAVGNVPAGSIRLVVIDGSHDYQSVSDDILLWTKMIEPGGVICGDDYNWPGVEQAVSEAFPDHKVHGKGNSRWWSVSLGSSCAL